MSRSNRDRREELLAALRSQWITPEFERRVREEAPYLDVADAVIGLRSAAGITQHELAERVGTTQSVIARLESGKHAVRTTLLNRVAASLGLNWRPEFYEQGVLDFLPDQRPIAEQGSNIIHLGDVRPELRHEPRAWAVSHRTDDAHADALTSDELRELFDRFLDSYVATRPRKKPGAKRRVAEDGSGYSSAV